MTLDTQASPMMSGIPSVVAYSGLLAVHGAKIMQKALESAAKSEMEHIRYEASKAPGWGQVSENIGVGVSKRHISYTASSRSAKRAMTKLEYGSLENAPVPVLRKQVGGMSERFTNNVSKYLDKVVR